METYALVKALSNFTVGTHLTARVNERYAPLDREIIFTVDAFRSEWTIVLTKTSVSMEWRGGEEPFSTAKTPVKTWSLCDHPWVLCCCWILVRKCWPELYSSVREVRKSVDLYTLDLFKTLSVLSEYKNEWFTLYLAAIALLHRPEPIIDRPLEDRIIRDAKFYKMTLGLRTLGLKHEESDLILYIDELDDDDDIGLASLGHMYRCLWAHLLDHVRFSM